MKNKNINPTLEDLEVLVGKWTMELSNASFLPNLSDTLKNTASIEWFNDGEFLVFNQGTKKTAHATWLISRDQDLSNYTVLYFDDRHVSRIYEMSFEQSLWKIWRNAPNFIQSFEGKISEDKETITGSWSKSTDGKKWEHDFDLIYKRIK